LSKLKRLAMGVLIAKSGQFTVSFAPIDR